MTEGLGDIVHDLHEDVRGESAPPTLTLTRALYAPGATTDLVSLPVLLEQGWRADFGSSETLLTKDEMAIECPHVGPF